MKDSSWCGWDWRVLAYASLLLVLLGLCIRPGMYVSDEVMYLLMADSVSQGGFEIYNGMGEYGSPELVLPSGVVRGGRLYSIYPPVYALLAQPFYRLFGTWGLFIVNSIGFAGSVILVYLISYNLFADKRFSAYSAVFYSLFTNGLEYGMDMWPHMLSVFLVLLSYYLALTGRLAASGFISGLSVGVRYPNALLAAILVLYVLYRRGLSGAMVFSAAAFLPTSLNLLFLGGSSAEAAIVGYDSVPGTVEYNPVHFNPYLLLLSIVAVASYILASRLNRRPVYTAALSVLLVSAVLFSVDGTFIKSLVSSLRVAYAEVFDMQSHPAPGVLAAKKGLLQASPIMVLCLLAPSLLKGRLRKGELLLLYAPAGAFILLYSCFYYMHGGLTPYMRYFLDTTPFISIFSAYSVYMLWSYKPSLNLVMFSIVLTAFFSFFLLESHVNDKAAWVFARAVPAIILVGLALSAAAYLRRPTTIWSLSAFIFLAAVYSLSANVSDTAKMAIARDDTAAVSSELKFIRDDSVLMVPGYLDVTTVGELKIGRRLRIADTSRDGLASAAGLLSHYKAAAIPVYLYDTGDPGFRQFIASNVTPYPHRLVVGNRTRVYVVG